MNHVVVITCHSGCLQYVSGKTNEELCDALEDATVFSRATAKVIADHWLELVQNLVNERGDILVHVARNNGNIQDIRLTT